MTMSLHAIADLAEDVWCLEELDRTPDLIARQELRCLVWLHFGRLVAFLRLGIDGTVRYSCLWPHHETGKLEYRSSDWHGFWRYRDDDLEFAFRYAHGWVERILDPMLVSVTACYNRRDRIWRARTLPVIIVPREHEVFNDSIENAVLDPSVFNRPSCEPTPPSSPRAMVPSATRTVVPSSPRLMVPPPLSKYVFDNLFPDMIIS